MKLKVKATGETLEVAPDSYVCGLHPNGNEVEFLAEDVEIIPNDWSAFRREAAKDILARSYNPIFEDEAQVKNAIKVADELIKYLQEEQKNETQQTI